MVPQIGGDQQKSPTSGFPGSKVLPSSAVHCRAYKNWTSNSRVAGVLWLHISKTVKTVGQLPQFPLVRSNPNLQKILSRYAVVLILEIGKI